MSWIESSSLFTYTGNKLQLNLTPQGNSKARAEFLLHECIHYYFHHKKLCSVFTLKEMQNIVLKIWLFPFGNSVGSLVVYDLCDFWEGPEFVLFFTMWWGFSSPCFSAHPGWFGPSRLFLTCYIQMLELRCTLQDLAQFFGTCSSWYLRLNSYG